MSSRTGVRVPGRASNGRRVAASPWLTLAVLCSSILMVNLDNTVLNVALPTLVRVLRASSSQLQWIVDAYAVVFGGLLLVAGSLGDRVGRKKTLLAGLILFGIGSGWAAFSGSVHLLIAARCGMGVGAALMMPATLSIITDVFPDSAERQKAIGVWAGTSGLGFALGPVVGGLLLDHFWWGSVLLINVPIAASGAVCAVPLVPDSRSRRARRPDLLGAALSVSGLVLVIGGIIEAPVEGWASWWALGPLAGGAVVLAAFAWWERTTAQPMIDLGLFRMRSFSAAVAGNGLNLFGLMGGLFLLTQFLQFQLGYTALQAGVRMLPVAAALAVVAPLSSLLALRVGSKITAASGLALAACGLWWVAGSTVAWGYTRMLPGMVLIGLGAALVMPTMSGLVMASLRPDDTGVGAAANGTFIQIGGALGVGVIGSLLSSRFQERLRPLITPFGLPHAARQAILGSVGGALKGASQIGGQHGLLLARAARAAFVSGSDLALAVGALVVGIGCVVALIALPSRTANPS